jgi:hypothetical protein
MSNIRSHVRVLALGVLSAGVVLSSAAIASAQQLLPPNLKAMPAGNIYLVNDTAAGTTTLRFATTSWNSGTGPLQLEAGAVDTGSGKQQVYQRLFADDGSSVLHLAGWFEYHPAHQHFHFDDYALYTLQPVNAPGGYQLTGSKTTFCVMDTTKVSNLPGSPGSAVYSTCGSTIQGMSVGWGDTYGAHLAGQELDFTSNADGIYQLKIEIDPKDLLIESDNTDNASCVLIDIKKPSTVTVLDFSGNCSTVQSITPNQAKVGTSVSVTITGYGFAPGMGVTFESGNGPRPLASNVVLVSDTDGLDTLTAVVTVPNKKQPSKDPVWDVRVGNGGVLRDAFRVVR